ncbi:hypothetical protein [Nocardia farcinica]|uniref:hypothetical protein n=1 Tax=Nocardia farcinica TaxID=37329 RepID=UPI001E2CF6CD|nr:hypothetical protein [Nocardia farcinica]MCZ9329405.1 hypothetical protein [Nocardia farcinica]
MTADSGLPGRAALEDVCGAQGLSTQNARLLHRRSNAVWLVEDVVVRLAPNTPLRRTRAATSIGVTRWLETTATEPIALAPLPVDQPILTGDAVATLWPYRPTDYRPRTADLARLVRRLHAQPAPPVPLPEYRPLLCTTHVDPEMPNSARFAMRSSTSMHSRPTSAPEGSVSVPFSARHARVAVLVRDAGNFFASWSDWSAQGLLARTSERVLRGIIGQWPRSHRERFKSC